MKTIPATPSGQLSLLNLPGLRLESPSSCRICGGTLPAGSWAGLTDDGGHVCSSSCVARLTEPDSPASREAIRQRIRELKEEANDLDALGDGPLSLREICAVLGVKYRPNVFHDRRTSHLGRLRRVGLVIYCGRRPYAPGPGRAEAVYDLSPRVRDALTCGPKARHAILAIQEAA